ncbi:ABC transporter permease [Nesterenkonia ebinurensis]|uniref:ABC transporter permease n=1 Tax=Nesterenkonia ebinurensis TaxID=2608252 RepID=UPI00123D7C2A|nr:hypothetical protein [Nesterenkonia ebinurensis]
MTTTTVTQARHAPSPASGKQSSLAGTWVLLRFMLRRDRIRTTVWVLSLGVLGAYMAQAPKAYADNEAELHDMATLFADPVTRMMTGPGFGMDDPSFERMFSAAYVLMTYLVIALFSIFTVVRHTRVEEETDREELVRANVVGRHARLTATLTLGVVANVIIAAIIFAGAAAEYSAEGSALVAVGSLAVGLFFLAITAVTVQLSEASRGASAMAGGVLALAYVIRMGGDAAEQGGNALSWFSPLAWTQQTAPYVEDRWWPLLLPFGCTVVFIWLGYFLSTKRDVGASLLHARLGRAEAKPSLGTPLGLASHGLLGGLRGWGIGLILSGLLFGSFAQTMIDAADDLPDDFAQLFAGDDMMLGYLAYMGVFMAVLVAAAAVSGITQLRIEESRGRAEYALSAPVGRSYWFGSHLTVLVVGVLLILGLTGLGMGIGAVASLDEGGGEYFGQLFLATFLQGSTVLAVIGIVAALFGWLPKAAGGVGWVIVGYGGIVAAFGGLLELPDWAYDLNIFGHLAQYPVDDISWAPILWLSLIGVVGITIGLLGFNRREVNRV